MNSVLLGSVRQSGQQIVADFSAITNQYSSNSLEIAFSLDASTVGFTSVALEVLIEDKCLNTVIPIKESKVTLPGYITQYSGILRLALAIIDDEQVITTNAIELEIIPSVNPAGATPPPIQIWQQQVSDFMEAYLQAEIDPDLKKLLEQAKKSMDDATKAVNDAKKSLSNADEAITIANTASIAANTAAKSANDITNEVKTKLEAGEFVGPKGPQGTPGGADGLSYVEDKLQLMQGEEKLGEPVLIKIKGVDIPLLKEPPTDGKVGDYFTLEGGGDPTLIGEVVSNIDNNNPKAAPNAQAVRRAIEDAQDLKEVKGNTLIVDVKQGLPALAIEGKTYQNITKQNSNLIVLEDASYTTTGGINVSVSKGVISLSGTATAGAEIKLCEVHLSPGTYYFKRNHDNVNLDVYYTDGVTQSSVDGSFVVEKEKRIAIYVYHNGSFVAPGTVKPMLNIGDLSLPWVAGVPNSPSPEFPAEIHGAGESLNLLKIPNQTTTVKGVTISVADGIITSVGTPTEFITVQLGTVTLDAGTYYFKRNLPNAVVDVVLVSLGVQDIQGDQVISLTEKRTYALYYVCSTTAGGTNVSKPMISLGKDVREWQPYGHRVAVKRLCGTSQLDIIYPLSSPLYEDDKIQPDGKILRKIKKFIFTGNEDFYINVPDYSFFAVLKKMPNSTNSICSHFTMFNTPPVGEQGMCIAKNGVWYVNYAGVADDITSLKTWLADQYAAGTPLTILYESSNSTTEYVTPSSQLELVDGVNTVQDAGVYPATLNLYYSKCGMPIFNAIKPQERIKIDSQKFDYFLVNNENDLILALNSSDMIENSSHYTFSINVRKSGLSLGGGVWMVEGYKTDQNWEWQIARVYGTYGLTEYKRSKLNGVWNAFV